MELANIEKLLKKYLNATTTLTEEKTLKAYFNSDNVAPHLQEYQALFSYFSTGKNERFTKTIHLKSQTRKWKWLSVAASLAIIVSVYYGYQVNEQKKAAKLYAETQFAFNLLAKNLNKGNNAIAELQEFESVKNKIFNPPK